MLFPFNLHIMEALVSDVCPFVKPCVANISGCQGCQTGHVHFQITHKSVSLFHIELEHTKLVMEVMLVWQRSVGISSNCADMLAG